MPDFGYNGITHNSYFITINYGFITGSCPDYPAASPLAVQTSWIFPLHPPATGLALAVPSARKFFYCPNFKLGVRKLRKLRFRLSTFLGQLCAQIAQIAVCALSLYALVFSYLPCSILCISPDCVYLVSQRFILPSAIPRTLACSTASCLVKAVGSIWKNCR